MAAELKKRIAQIMNRDGDDDDEDVQPKGKKMKIERLDPEVDDDSEEDDATLDATALADTGDLGTSLLKCALPALPAFMSAYIGNLFSVSSRIAVP
jgi:hypothetical protein